MEQTMKSKVRKQICFISIQQEWKMPRHATFERVNFQIRFFPGRDFRAGSKKFGRRYFQFRIFKQANGV
jgi:hypothetical protein